MSRRQEQDDERRQEGRPCLKEMLLASSPFNVAHGAVPGEGQPSVQGRLGPMNEKQVSGDQLLTVALYSKKNPPKASSPNST